MRAAVDHKFTAVACIGVTHYPASPGGQGYYATPIQKELQAAHRKRAETPENGVIYLQRAYSPRKGGKFPRQRTRRTIYPPRAKSRQNAK